jgi:hypothetical protein
MDDAPECFEREAPLIYQRFDSVRRLPAWTCADAGIKIIFVQPCPAVA